MFSQGIIIKYYGYVATLYFVNLHFTYIITGVEPRLDVVITILRCIPPLRIVLCDTLLNGLGTGIYMNMTLHACLISRYKNAIFVSIHESPKLLDRVTRPFVHWIERQLHTTFTKTHIIMTFAEYGTLI